MPNLPRKTQAAILVELRQPLVLAEIELPPSLAAGQVLVQVHYSGICGSQLGEIDGAKGEDKFLPHLLGHEGSATVLAVGDGVRHVKPEDKVVLHWRKGLGIEAAPPAYNWDGRRVNAGWITTFNEFAVVSENRCTTIPPDTDLQIAALLGCAVPTGFGVVENNANLKIGESVVVFGAGGVGLNIVQAAAMRSAYPIIAIDLHQNRLDLAIKMGATHTILNSNLDQTRGKILEILGNYGLDVFIDNTGIPKVIESGYQITHPQGRVILVGVPRKDDNINIYSLPLHFGKTLTGSHGGESVPHLDITRFIKLLKSRNPDLHMLISNKYQLEEINLAINDQRNGNIPGRGMICLAKSMDMAAR